MEELLKSIRENEGFEGMPYKDHLGYDTIGIGTKLPITEEEAMMLARIRLEAKESNLITRWGAYNRMPEDIQYMCLEMCYQLGVSGFLKFKKMVQALEKNDWNTAYNEGLDSKWATQTPNRAKKVLQPLTKKV